ncbi:MAG: apolipoprotein N-acyltransferase, partial [Deltaproteobacteria bacterium]|nr:apolipoprotein N-acyltransferase [Deltaproteobacteria bacterium]
RAANTGISAVVGTDGAIRATLPQFRRGSLVEVVRLSQGGSLYTRIGDLFAQLCAAGAVLLGVILCRRRP